LVIFDLLAGLCFALAGTQAPIRKIKICWRLRELGFSACAVLKFLKLSPEC
jgi:hypothetical protein